MSKNISPENSQQQQPIIVNINNPVVRDDADIAKLARTIKNIDRAGLTDNKYGKSKYRMA
jgi:hypothetical protein